MWGVALIVCVLGAIFTLCGHPVFASLFRLRVCSRLPTTGGSPRSLPAAIALRQHLSADSLPATLPTARPTAARRRSFPQTIDAREADEANNDQGFSFFKKELGAGSEVAGEDVALKAIEQEMLAVRQLYKNGHLIINQNVV